MFSWKCRFVKGLAIECLSDVLVVFALGRRGSPGLFFLLQLVKHVALSVEKKSFFYACFGVLVQIYQEMFLKDETVPVGEDVLTPGMVLSSERRNFGLDLEEDYDFKPFAECRPDWFTYLGLLQVSPFF